MLGCLRHPARWPAGDSLSRNSVALTTDPRTAKQADENATDAVWTQAARVQPRSTSTGLYIRNGVGAQPRRSRTPADAVPGSWWSGLQDDPAGNAASRLRTVRLDCLSERINRADLRAQVPLVDQARQFGQLNADSLPG